MGNNYQRRRFSSAPRGEWGSKGCAVWVALGLGGLSALSALGTCVEAIL